MRRPRRHNAARRRSAALTLALLTALAGSSARAAPPEPSEANAPAEADAPAEGPAEGPAPASEDEAGPPAPTIQPAEDPGASIDFAVPPPESAEDEDEPAKPKLAAAFPDPGTAPNDGRNMIVLGGVTLGSMVVLTTSGIVLGLRYGVEPRYLLPGLLIPAIGFTAFAAGGLYLGITRARKHRRWAIANRVVGLPQGGGLLVGGTFTLLAGLGMIPGGIFLLQAGELELGVPTLVIGSAAALATPLMFVFGARNKRRYLRTGGWTRKPVPPLPPSSRLELAPRVSLVPGGLGIGVAGRF